MVKKCSQKRDFLQMEERRKKGILLLEKEGKSQSEVARLLGVSRQAVHKWYWTYKRGGFKTLAHRKATGRPKKFDDKARKKLISLLLQGARKFNFPTDLWTIDRIVKLIRQEFGISLHRSHVHRIVIAMGFSCQKSIARAKERNEKIVQRWLKTT